MPEIFSQIISVQFFVRTNSYFEIHSRIYLFLRKPNYYYSTAYIKGKSNWSSLNDENLIWGLKEEEGGGVFTRIPEEAHQRRGERHFDFLEEEMHCTGL